MDIGEGRAGQVFPIFRETAAASEPGESAFDDPAAGKKLEALGRVGAFDDFRFEVWQDLRQSLLELGFLIPAVGKKFLQEREHAKQCPENQYPAVAVVNVRRMNHGVEQKAYRINKDRPFLALDLLPRVIAVRVNLDPPFSVLFTL